jgi:negative regulator of flagellin synthesis FlgM
MPNPINNLGPSYGTQATSGRPAQKAADRGASATAGQDAAAPALGEATRMAMASDADFDKAKVDAIREAIASGTYAIDPRKIAESFAKLEKLL